MPLHKTALMIPETIEFGLKTGELIQHGSVVRDAATGNIVKHLAEVTIKPSTNVKAVEVVRLAAGKSPVVAGTFGGAALVAVGATAAIPFMRKRAKEAKIQQRVEDRFTAAATAWFDADSAGAMTTEILSELQKAWDEYDASNKEWEAQPNDLAVSLMQRAMRWNDQHGPIKKSHAATDGSTCDTVVDLSDYLAAQREELSETA